MVIREAGFSLEYFHVVMNKLRLFSSMEYLKANASKFIELRPNTGNLPHRQYAIEPGMNCKASTNALTWQQPNILEVKGPPLC